MTEQFDVIIVGSGQGGNPLANAMGNAGKKTAVIEREHIGGTCVNVGCTPTKTMIASGRVAYLVRRAADYGVNTGEISVDMKVVRKRKRDIVDQWRSGSEKGLAETPNVEVLMGEGRFAGPQTISVKLNDGGTRELTAETIVINVGERPSPVDVPGVESIGLLNSTTIMELDEVPEHLLVLGGGIIGLEFGQLFHRLGAKVTIVHRGKQLLSREDPDIAAEVKKILEEDGITVLLESQVTAFSGKSGAISAELDVAGEPKTIGCSHVLGAIGRTSKADSLDAATVGLKLDEKGYIPTDDQFRTNLDGVYAIGDVRPGPKFTHVSYDDYRYLKANLLDGENRSIAGRLVPSTMFTDPQLGRIGLSETEAKKAGVRYRVARMPMSRVARATETAEPRGVLKALVDPETDRILGAAILGIEGGELMSMIQIAMMGDLPYTALRDGIFAHPGYTEGFNNLFFAFEE